MLPAVSSAIYQNRKFQMGKRRPEKRKSGSEKAISPSPLPRVPVPDRQQIKSHVPILYILLLGDNPPGISMAWQWLITQVMKYLLHTQ